MKRKILVVSVLIIVFTFTTSVYAVGQNSRVETDSQVQLQTQTANQGEDSQIQIQNNEQLQVENTVGENMGTQTQQQVQQQLQDGSGAGNQVQNQGKTNQLQESGQQQMQSQTGSALSEQRRSRVANAVQEMLQIVEANGGVGQQIKVIAQNQNQNQEKIEASLQKVQNRSGFAKFFIGANYGEINNAKKILEQNHEQIQQLNKIKSQLSSQNDQKQLTVQIQTLEQINLQIGNYLETAQKGFSLFGWMFRLFSK
jgi:hypothetical protein